MSRDPIGFWGGGANLLTYVGNDPVSGVDPEGLWPNRQNIGTSAENMSGPNYWRNSKAKTFWATGAGVFINPTVALSTNSSGQRVPDFNPNQLPLYYIGGGGELGDGHYKGFPRKGLVYGFYNAGNSREPRPGGLMLGIGPDLNGNHLLDNNERRAWAGQCEKPNGFNGMAWIENRYIKWWNDADGGKGDDVVKFVYDTKTGGLHVTRLIATYHPNLPLNNPKRRTVRFEPAKYSDSGKYPLWHTNPGAK